MSSDSSIMEYSMSRPGSAPGSATGSPRDKVKFLCSHGGKILPRPLDGHLKYVGGETRIISVPRQIKFGELMKKLTYLIEGDMVLKYQLVPEDLDALVSVKSNEDLRHMFDEYERNEIAGAPRLRTFLFPAKPIVLENHTEVHGLEQRYIDAVNGFIRASPPPAATKQRPVLHITRPAFGMSHSDTASPSSRSPESSCTDILLHEPMPSPNNYHIHRNHMYRVHSSPSMYNLNNGFQPLPYNNHYQNSRQQQQPQYQNHHQGKPPFDPYKNVGPPERLVPVKGSISRYQSDPFPPPHHYLSTKQSNRGSGSCNSTKFMHVDDYSSWMDRRTEKGLSLPPSPLSLSPRANSQNPKPWDGPIIEDN